MVGGYYTSVLAEMKPFTLDLETLVWHCWEGVEPVPTEASGPSQSAAAPAMPKLPGLPEPRQRMAAQRISHDWLLISGGSPASVRTARALIRILLADSRRLAAHCCNRVESHGRQDPCHASADCLTALH